MERIKIILVDAYDAEHTHHVYANTTLAEFARDEHIDLNKVAAQVNGVSATQEYALRDGDKITLKPLNIASGHRLVLAE